MERKKKREKPLANGSAVDGASGQPGDVHLLQREVEQQGSAKKLASGAANDSPTQPFLPSFNWSFAQHPSTQQQSAHASMPQPHGQAALQQATSQQGPQGASQPLPSGWQSPEAFGQSAGPGHHHPFQSGLGESNWPQAAAGAQNIAGRPPPFTFPPPPYPGPWDPVSWWAHNPYQPPYPYLFPGYGGGYPCPMPPAPSMGTNQRGLIKPPPSLSQKHVRMWETQSMENMQLWSTTTQLWTAVTRADTEISLQRSKIRKLEADLQAIKAHWDGQMPQAEATAASQPAARRGRRRKAAPAPLVTVAGLPASESIPSQAPGRKARANTSKVDLAKKAKEVETKVKEKSTLSNHVSGLVFRPPVDAQDQKSCPPTVGSIRSESGLEKNPLRQTVEYQGSTNNRLTVAKDDLAFGHVNHHASPFRPSNLPTAGKDINCEQSLEMKESIIVGFLKNTGNLDHQGIITADSPFTAAMNRGDLCLDANGNDMAKDAVVRSQLQAHYDTNNIEKSNALSSGKAIPSWQYTGEDGSDEQDEGVASGQDDDEADDNDDEDDDDDENNLDDMHSEKVGNYMVLDALSMKWN